MIIIVVMLALAFWPPVGYITVAWTLLAIAAAFKGFYYLWGVFATGSLGLVIYDYFPRDVDATDVAFQVVALAAYGSVVFVICLLFAAWRSDRTGRKISETGNIE